MLTITKVFRFEAAHAIHNYPGSCAHIHGHSYELHVTVKMKQHSDDYINGMGIVIDFKDLKDLIKQSVLKLMDHKIILSKKYLTETKRNFSVDELLAFDYEPTAENLLLFLRDKIISDLPESIQLTSLKLWETRDSFAEWSAI